MKSTVIFLLMLASSHFALAQEDTVIKEADKVIFKKETDLDFSDVMVNGELIKPDAAYIKDRRKTSFEALIQLRANFRPELMQTMSYL